MESNSEQTLKPPPPPNLSKEHQGIWGVWCTKGDREIAREAATKRIDIKLVLMFLSAKKQLSAEQAKSFFKEEVLIWVRELLDRKQIFRVSHVLTNIGEDPDEELTKTFYTTTNKELRAYIGNHLEQINKLDKNMKDLWHFLDLFLNNSVLVIKYKLQEESIECLNKQNDEWRSEIGARLFLKTHDNMLLPYLNGAVIWKQLLFYRNTKLLNAWIDIRFSDIKETHNVPENLFQIFKTFPITSEMISYLYTTEVTDNIRQIILKALGKFGIFSDDDMTNLVSILCRLDQSDNLLNIYDIISKQSDSISINTFLKLLLDYCAEHNLFHVLNTCIRNFDIDDIPQSTKYLHLTLILDFRIFIKQPNEIKLRDNILNVSKFLCGDLTNYFKDNPLILLSLLLFTKDLKLWKVLSDRSIIMLDQELFQCFTKLFQNFKILNAVRTRNHVVENCSITYYDLLNTHLHIRTRELYHFQFKESPMPNFNSPSLMSSYGYSKEMDYLFYVKQMRPSIACKIFLINEYRDHNGVTEDSIMLVQRKMFKLALKNVISSQVTSSSIAFLEMLGINADFLRVSIRVANVLLKTGHDVNYVVNLFMNVKNDPYPILTLLETVIVEQINFNEIHNISTFIDVIKAYDLPVKFAVIFKLKLPVLFLKNCASNNMWLPFFIFVQLKNYPTEQVKMALQSLKNPNLLEHVNHSVVYNIQVDEKNILMRERDLRTSFFSRLGVHKSIDSLNQTESIHSSITSQTSYGSTASSAGSDLLEIDIWNTKATLLQTLIQCHNSSDPPRALLQACQLYKNPLLAILATSYEPDSIITNWLTWLAVSSEQCQTFNNFDSMGISPRAVAGLLNNCMKHGFPIVLQQSCEIFIPNNPLRYFLDFLNSCINLNLDVPTIIVKLDAYKIALNKCRRYSLLTETDHEMTYFNNKEWVERTALLLLLSAIEYNIYSLYDQIQVVQILCNLKIEKYMHCPNIHNFLNILKCILDSNCSVRFNVGMYFDTRNGRKSVVDCINQLLDIELFEVALKIAQIEGLPLDLIVIKEWQHKYENWDHIDMSFWKDSSECFTNYNITADCVIEFYLHYIDSANNHLEKYQLLKLAHKWARTFELSNKYEIEKRKLLAYVMLDDKGKKYSGPLCDDEKPFYFTYKEMQQTLDSISEYEDEIAAEALDLLEHLQKDALNNGSVWLALKLGKMFGCKCSDLDLLKLCFCLAEGITLPFQLTTEQRLLLNGGGNLRRLSHRRTFLSNRLSSLSSVSQSPGSHYIPETDAAASAPVQDTLALIYAISEKLKVGNDIAYRIFMTYRISLNIEIPYQVVVSNTDYRKMLKDALEDDCMHKLDVVQDFIRVYNWSKAEITDFICEEIVNAALKYVKSKCDEILMWNIKMDQEFHLILQLIPEGSSLLGHKIYSYASAVHKMQLLANLEFKISELALVVELLITAHNCFTADCNMEGISSILKKCQNVVSHLLTLRSWKLIVRLLTGVRRYTEMTYVFQILRTNDQFEFLLRKGSRKDNALKLALLDYLKKYCPDNHELFKIVALHFTLFSEVALLWEREAQSVIRNLIAISKLEMQNNMIIPENHGYVLLTNTDGTRLCLNKAVENYSHATEFHLQGEKLSKAMNSAKQAELIALQISILKGLPNNGTALCLLNLNETQISPLISSELSFDQSLTLVNAYNYTPDWASVLFEQCILWNNVAYVNSFLNHISLTDAIANDISRKFLAANIETPCEMKSMRNILIKLPSIHTKYRIASELGFIDLVEDLITGGQLDYLKDTVWKKGYRG